MLFFCAKNRFLISRQLPVMARLMVRITESTTQQVRDTRRYENLNFQISRRF